jgi:hypothetical protein
VKNPRRNMATSFKAVCFSAPVLRLIEHETKFAGPTKNEVRELFRISGNMARNYVIYTGHLTLLGE